MPEPTITQVCGRCQSVPSVVQIFSLSGEYVDFCQACLQADIDSVSNLIAGMRREVEKMEADRVRAINEAELYRRSYEENKIALDNLRQSHEHLDLRHNEMLDDYLKTQQENLKLKEKGSKAKKKGK